MVNGLQWERETKFKIASWATLALSILVMIDSFLYFDFYFYLIFIAGILGLIGAVFSLGIFPIIGGLATSGGILFLVAQFGFVDTFLLTLLKTIPLIIGGCGMIFWFEGAEDPLSTELSRLDIGGEDFFELKTMGITNLKELVDEKGHEEEICSLTSISISQLKAWIEQAEKILQETEKSRKAQLQRDFKRKYKK